MRTVLVPLEAKDYRFLRFGSDKSEDFGEYTQEIKINGDSAQVLIRGNHNGIQADFYFIFIDGKWFLQGYKDVSM